MILYVNSNSEIKDVNSTTNTTLTSIEISDNPDENPFIGWTVAKICCYRVQVDNKKVVSYSPYIPSSIVELIDRLAKEDAKLERRANSTDRELDELLTSVIPRMMG